MTSGGTTIDIGEWLRGLGLGQYEITFRENDIDTEILPDLTELDLEKLGLSLGHRKRLLKAIAVMREKSVPALQVRSLPRQGVQIAEAGMEGWEPIATAPKDGRYIQVVRRGEVEETVGWSERHEGWVLPIHPLDLEQATVLAWDPTHWRRESMPMRAPSSEEPE